MEMSSNGSSVAQDARAGWDAKACKAFFAALTPAEKQLAVYWLLKDLVGDRPDRESGIYDPEGFLYLWLVPPGLREYFRLLEHPELEEHLQRVSTEPAVPLQQFREELGITE
jgi:hypothetical protein